MVTALTNLTTVSCKTFRCSGRGLILPFGIEACMSIPLRAVLYFIFLLYLFLGIAIIADIFMGAIETITSKKRKIKYPDPEKPEKISTIEVSVWNATVAYLTLMALGSSAPEILLSIIEIIGNRFQSGELGPGTIVGSAAYNLLVISALCIMSIKAPETRRIQLYTVFMITSFFGFFAYIWLFIVLSVISKDVVDLWEAVITFLLFPILVILSYLAEKKFFASKNVILAEAEQSLLFPSPGTEQGHKSQEFRQDLLQFLRELGPLSNISLEEKAQLFSAKISDDMQRSPMHYRIQGIRMLTGGRSIFIDLPDKLQEIYAAVKNRDSVHDEQIVHAVSALDPRPIIQLTAVNYAVLEHEQKVDILINRTGPIDVDVRFRIDTIDGTANAGEDYIRVAEEFVMKRGEQEKKLTIQIIDDNQWEPDETFFVKLSLPTGEEKRAKLGSKTIALVTIINDDDPGNIQFEKNIYIVKESVGTAEIKVLRVDGADGRVTVRYRTQDMEAKAPHDYQAADGELVFEHGEISKTIGIPIVNDLKPEKTENFLVELYNPGGGSHLGKFGKAVVTIINDDDYNTIKTKIMSMVEVDIKKLNVTRTSWSQKFREAMNVKDGDTEEAKFTDYIAHSLSFFWKVLFAFVPPTSIAGGWVTFFVSLIFIAILTAIVGDVAAIFGCLVGLKDSITAISFVALGTSLPDTFASMISAKKSKIADDAIGNITGSNSVNVFLGLGLPWLIAAIYWESKNLPFTVKAGDLSFSILIFSICCVLCMTVLVLRRYVGFFGKAELGGPTVPKYICAIFFIFLWVAYLTLSGLQAYGHIKWQS